jgi:hypothetical protein
VFSSTETSLVAGDANGHQDIFVRDVVENSTNLYGWSPTQSTGCKPSVSFNGIPSATAGSGFDLSLTGVRGLQPGIFIYSRSGPSSFPQVGFHLYLAAPIVRALVRN